MMIFSKVSTSGRKIRHLIDEQQLMYESRDFKRYVLLEANIQAEYQKLKQLISGVKTRFQKIGGSGVGKAILRLFDKIEKKAVELDNESAEKPGFFASLGELVPGKKEAKEDDFINKLKSLAMAVERSIAQIDAVVDGISEWFKLSEIDEETIKTVTELNKGKSPKLGQFVGEDVGPSASGAESLLSLMSNIEQPDDPKKQEAMKATVEKIKSAANAAKRFIDKTNDKFSQINKQNRTDIKWSQLGGRDLQITPQQLLGSRGKPSGFFLLTVEEFFEFTNVFTKEIEQTVEKQAESKGGVLNSMKKKKVSPEAQSLFDGGEKFLTHMDKHELFKNLPKKDKAVLALVMAASDQSIEEIFGDEKKTESLLHRAGLSLILEAVGKSKIMELIGGIKYKWAMDKEVKKKIFAFLGGAAPAEKEEPDPQENKKELRAIEEILDESIEAVEEAGIDPTKAPIVTDNNKAGEVNITAEPEEVQSQIQQIDPNADPVDELEDIQNPAQVKKDQVIVGKEEGKETTDAPEENKDDLTEDQKTHMVSFEQATKWSAFQMYLNGLSTKGFQISEGDPLPTDWELENSDPKDLKEKISAALKKKYPGTEKQVIAKFDELIKTRPSPPTRTATPKDTILKIKELGSKSNGKFTKAQAKELDSYVKNSTGPIQFNSNLPKGEKSGQMIAGIVEVKGFYHIEPSGLGLEYINKTTGAQSKNQIMGDATRLKVLLRSAFSIMELEDPVHKKIRKKYKDFFDKNAAWKSLNGKDFGNNGQKVFLDVMKKYHPDFKSAAMAEGLFHKYSLLTLILEKLDQSVGDKIFDELSTRRYFKAPKNKPVVKKLIDELVSASGGDQGPKKEDPKKPEEKKIDAEKSKLENKKKDDAKEEKSEDKPEIPGDDKIIAALKSIAKMTKKPRGVGKNLDDLDKKYKIKSGAGVNSAPATLRAVLDDLRSKEDLDVEKYFKNKKLSATQLDAELQSFGKQKKNPYHKNAPGTPKGLRSAVIGALKNQGLAEKYLRSLSTSVLQEILKLSNQKQVLKESKKPEDSASSAFSRWTKLAGIK